MDNSPLWIGKKTPLRLWFSWPRYSGRARANAPYALSQGIGVPVPVTATVFMALCPKKPVQHCQEFIQELLDIRFLFFYSTVSIIINLSNRFYAIGESINLQKNVGCSKGTRWKFLDIYYKFSEHIYKFLNYLIIVK